MRSNWLSDADWKRVQETVPVCCVDVLPVRRGAEGAVENVGLILRDTPHQGRRWCVVGGRLLRNESLAEGASRQIRETLGDAVRFQIDAAAQPAFVAQYFTSARPVGIVEPRQHAIGMTFIIEIGGQTQARGEAFAFRWFEVAEIPTADEFGFGQNRVVEACLKLK